MGLGLPRHGQHGEPASLRLLPPSELCGCWPPLASVGLRWPGQQGRRSRGPPDLVQRGEALGRPSGAAQGRVALTALHRPVPSARGFRARPWEELAFPTSCLWGSQRVASPPRSRPCSSSLFFLCPHSLGSPGQGRSHAWCLSASGTRAPHRPRTSSPWHQSPWHPPQRAASSRSFGPLAVRLRSPSPRWRGEGLLAGPRPSGCLGPGVCSSDSPSPAAWMVAGASLALPGFCWRLAQGGTGASMAAYILVALSCRPSRGSSSLSPGEKPKLRPGPPCGIPPSVAGAPAFLLVLMLLGALTPCAGVVAPELRSPPTWPPASPGPDHTWNMGVRLVSQGGKLQKDGAVRPDRSVRIPRVAPARQVPGEVKAGCENKGWAAEG